MQRIQPHPLEEVHYITAMPLLSPVLPYPPLHPRIRLRNPLTQRRLRLPAQKFTPRLWRSDLEESFQIALLRR